MARLFSVSLLGKLLTFFKEWVVVFYFGTGFIKDGFTAIYSFTAFLVFPMVDSVSRIWIPQYHHWKEPRRVATQISAILILFIFLVTVFAGIFGKSSFHLVYGNLHANAFQFALSNWTIMLLFSCGFFLTTLFSVMLAAEHHFWCSELRQIVLNLAIFVCLVGHLRIGNIHPLVLGFGLGMLGSVVVMGWAVLAYRLVDLSVLKHFFLDIFSFGFWQDTWEFWRMFGVGVALALASLVPMLLMQHGFSAAGPAWLAASDYAQKIQFLVLSLTIPVVLTPFSNWLAKQAKLGQFPSLAIFRVMAALLLGLLMVVFFTATLGRPVLHWILVRGAFDGQAFSITYPLIVGYLVVLVAQGVWQLLAQILLSYKALLFYSVSVVVTQASIGIFCFFVLRHFSALFLPYAVTSGQFLGLLLMGGFVLRIKGNNKMP